MLTIFRKPRKDFDPHSIVLLTLASLACLLFLTIGAALASDFSQEFVTQVFMGSEFEVESSQLALQKTHDRAIKSFAKRMVDDHTVVKDNLVVVVQTAPDVSAVMPSTRLDQHHRQILHALQEKSGADFDKLYVKDQIWTHSETISEFQSYLKNGPVETLRVFAQRTLPTLQAHQQTIRRICASMES